MFFFYCSLTTKLFFLIVHKIVFFYCSLDNKIVFFQVFPVWRQKKIHWVILCWNRANRIQNCFALSFIGTKNSGRNETLYFFYLFQHFIFLFVLSLATKMLQYFLTVFCWMRQIEFRIASRCQFLGVFLLRKRKFETRWDNLAIHFCECHHFYDIQNVLVYGYINIIIYIYIYMALS